MFPISIRQLFLAVSFGLISPMQPLPMADASIQTSLLPSISTAIQARTSLIGNSINSVVDFTNNTLKLDLNNASITAAGINTGDTLYISYEKGSGPGVLKSAADGSEVIDFYNTASLPGRGF